MKFSKFGFARFLLLTTMVCFSGALLRNPMLSEISEVLKFPLLAGSIAFLLYLRPVFRFTVASVTMWSFLIVVIISTAYNNINSTDLIASIGVFIAIAIYFQAINNVASAECLFKPLLCWFSFGVIFSSLVFLPYPDSFIGGRFAAGFINTNVASGFLAMAVVVLSYIVFFESNKGFYIFLLSAAFFLLILTKGRGALVAALLPVALMFLSNWKQCSPRANLIRVAGLVVAILIGVKIDFADTTNATELGILSFRAFELGARESIIGRHLSSFWQSPVIGVGAVIDKTDPMARSSGESSYTDLLALSGILGITLVGVLIFRALWVHWRNTESRFGFYVLFSVLLLAVSEGYFVSIASVVSMTLWALLAISPRRSGQE